MKSISNYIYERLSLNSQSQLTKNNLTQEQIKEFVSDHLSDKKQKVTAGLIRSLQKEVSLYCDDDIDSVVYNDEHNQSSVKDLMLFTAKHFNVTFEELWNICDKSSRLFREIIQKINPQKFM